MILQLHLLEPVSTLRHSFIRRPTTRYQHFGDSRGHHLLLLIILEVPGPSVWFLHFLAAWLQLGVAPDVVVNHGCLCALNVRFRQNWAEITAVLILAPD